MRAVIRAVLFCAALNMGAASVLAEQVKSQNATLISPATVQNPDEIKPPAQLEVGPVRGEFISTSPSGRYGAGSSAFVQITFSTDVKHSRNLRTEILLDAQNGEIAGVSGNDVDATQEGATYRAKVDGLRKGRDKSVLVEVKLRAVPDNTPNKLKITVRSGEQKSKRQDFEFSEETVELQWNVADCAAEYQASLRNIGNNGGNALLELWRRASQKDKSAPGSWIFKPDIPKRSRRSRAKNSEMAGLPVLNARAVYLQAGQFLRSGADPAFRRKSNLDWTVTKTSNDLKKYFSQDDHPAICTGVDRFASYYEERLAPLKERGVHLRKLADDAKHLMRKKAKEILVEAALSKSDGHPAWGGASLSVLKPAVEMTGDAKDFIAAIAKASGLPNDMLNEIKSAKTAYDGLIILKRAEEELSIAPHFNDALAAIEASLHIDYALGRQQKLEAGFFGNLKAIRDAHAKSCNCNG